MRDIRAAAVQFEHRDGDKAANLATVRRFVAAAAAQQVELIAFPECCLTGYWYLRHLDEAALRRLAEPVPDGPCTQELLALSKAHGMTIGAGLVEAGPDGRLHNTYVVAMPDGRHVRHRKLHTFVNPRLTSGDEFTVADTPHGVRIGVLTCYDNNINENGRLMALKGVEVLFAPHQTGGCDSPDPHCMGRVPTALWEQRHTNPAAIEAEFYGPKGRGWLMRWLPSRAHDNGYFLLFSNGVGRDDDEVRTGNAMILDPYGRLLSETWQAADAMVVADLEAALLARPTGRRWIRTRRPELYADLARPTGQEVDVKISRFDKTGV
jgi:predicted amidohydrolase